MRVFLMSATMKTFFLRIPLAAFFLVTLCLDTQSLSSVSSEGSPLGSDLCVGTPRGPHSSPIIERVAYYDVRVVAILDEDFFYLLGCSPHPFWSH